jgi:hypothetical protein
MWRPGPNGQGTLCNACGLQWKNGDILKDAPVISPEEEKQLLKEKKEREKILAKLEEEKQDREKQKNQVKLEKHASDATLETRKHQSNSSSSSVASKPKNKQSQKQPHSVSAAVKTTQKPNTTEQTSTATNVNKNSTTAPKTATTSTAPAAASTATKNTTIAPATTATSSSSTSQPQPIYPAPAAQQQQQQSIPLLYSAKGIPLPTLSVDFNSQTSFSHPRCGVTLLDHHFSLRLSSEPPNQTTINFTKLELRDCVFEVLEQETLPREILKMSIRPNKNVYDIYGTKVQVGKDNPVNIQFLEKIDPNGGAVVKRILERWIYFSS